MEKTKRKSAKSQKHKSEIEGETVGKKKEEKQQAKTRGKNGLVHLHLFCFFDLFFCFNFVFLLFPGKKQKIKHNKCKIKEKQINPKGKNKCQKKQMDKSIFSRFFALCPPFFPHLLCFLLFQEASSMLGFSFSLLTARGTS